jgi:hypothetical protein
MGSPSLPYELHQALQAAGTELGKKYIIAKHMTLKDSLRFGEVDLALERLDRLRRMLAGGQACDAIVSPKSYIQNNRDGIGYINLFEQGSHVGCGSIEKAGDLIISRR